MFAVAGGILIAAAVIAAVVFLFYVWDELN